MKKIIFVLPLLAMMVVGCANPADNEEETISETTSTVIDSQESETSVTPEKAEEVKESKVEEEPKETTVPEISEIQETKEPEKTVESKPVKEVKESETVEEPKVDEKAEESETVKESEEVVIPEEPQKVEDEIEESETPQEPEDKSPYEYVLPTGVSYDDYTYVGDYVFSDLYDFENCIWFNGTANSEYGYFMVLEKITRVKYNGDDEQIFYLYDFDTDTYPALEKGTKYKIYFKKSFLDSKPGTTLDNGKIRIINTFGVTKDKSPDGNIFTIYANDDAYNAFTIQGCVDVNDYVAY